MTAPTPAQVEAALAVVERLLEFSESDSEHEFCHDDEARQALATLTDALAERERDAARWRFVASGLSRGKTDLLVAFVDWNNHKEYTVLTDQRADDAVDEAMKDTP